MFKKISFLVIIIFIITTACSNKKEIERLKTETNELRLKLETLTSEYSNLKSYNDKVLADLKENKLVTRTQLLQLCSDDMAVLAGHFDSYDASLKSFYQYTMWMEANLLPYVQDYSKYAKGTLLVSAWLPLPYVKTASDTLAWGISILENVGLYTATANELQNAMIKITTLHRKYIETGDYLYLHDATQETTEVFIVKFAKILEFAETLRLCGERSGDVLIKIKQIKLQAGQQAKGTIVKMATWMRSSSDESQNLRNAQEVPPLSTGDTTEDALDCFVAKLSQNTEEFKNEVSVLSQKFKQDLNLASNLNAYRKILSLTDR